MRADLVLAMKERDRATVNVLRTTLSAIANAEAPAQEPATVPTQAIGSPQLAGLTEHPRLVLTDDEVARVVAGEIADREQTIAQLDGAGRTAEAAALRAELAILGRYAG
jgi:uncharacterized protein YqeY